MAKVKVIFGKLRGKVGGVVFRGGENGETIASEYNGEPRNPRTMLQTAQRSKMNVAGIISKGTPYSAIAGLGGSRRQARSKYVSNLLKLAQNSNETANQINTSVNLANLVISNGRRVMVSGTLALGTQNNEINVTITGTDPNVTFLGFKVVAYLPMPGAFGGVVVRDVEYNASSMQTSIPLPAPVGSYSGDDVANIIVVPIIDTGDASRVAYSQSLTMESVSVEGGAIRTLLASGAYAESVFLGSMTIE